MGRCGATELRGATAGTTSPAANRHAVRVTAATPMPVTVQATIPVPATLLVTVLVTALARGGRGAFRAMYRATGDRDERPGGRLVASAVFLSATQRV
jgi:hypothetical protein